VIRDDLRYTRTVGGGDWREGGMTEAEWLVCTDPGPKLSFLGERASERKRRLFAVACCRPMERWLTDEVRDILAGIELYMDRPGKPPIPILVYPDFHPNLTSETIVSQLPARRQLARWLQAAGTSDIIHLCNWAVNKVGESANDRGAVNRAIPGEEIQAARDAWATAQAAREAERSRLCGLLHEVMGNPFRPAVGLPVDVSRTVPYLAEAAYANRESPSGELDPARLAVLSDALEEAGCADADLLAHLRSPGPHVRGCWAVDLILGKA
jgi:hypothetical protein